MRARRLQLPRQHPPHRPPRCPRRLLAHGLLCSASKELLEDIDLLALQRGQDGAGHVLRRRVLRTGRCFDGLPERCCPAALVGQGKQTMSPLAAKLHPNQTSRPRNKHKLPRSRFQPSFRQLRAVRRPAPERLKLAHRPPRARPGVCTPGRAPGNCGTEPPPRTSSAGSSP